MAISCPLVLTTACRLHGALYSPRTVIRKAFHLDQWSVCVCACARGATWSERASCDLQDGQHFARQTKTRRLVCGSLSSLGHVSRTCPSMNLFVFFIPRLTCQTCALGGAKVPPVVWPQKQVARSSQARSRTVVWAAQIRRHLCSTAPCRTRSTSASRPIRGSRK